MKIYYNPKLKALARELRNNATAAEKRLWKYLRGKHMRGYDFHRQKPIDNYIVDFFCYHLQLVIEVDGRTHGFSEVYERDIKKEDKLNELGLHVMRFSDEEVLSDITTVLRNIELYIEKFEQTPGQKLSNENTHP